MKTPTFIVRGIKTKTKAKFYQDINVQDYIEVIYNLRKYHSSSYVSYVTVKNLSKNLSIETSIHQVSYFLDKFDLEEVYD